MFPTFSRSRLQARRRETGLNRDALACLVGLSAATIKAYEQGHKVPSAGALGRLSRVLGCSVDDLFELEQVTTDVA